MGRSPWSRTRYYGFCAGIALALAVVPEHSHNLAGIALGLLILALVIPARIFWLHERHGWWTGMSFVLYFLGFAVLQHATGGTDSLLTPMIVLPVAGGALHGGLRQLAAVVGGVFVTLVLPPAVLSQATPTSHTLSLAVSWSLVSACVGLVVHGLVSQLAGRDREQRSLLAATESYGIISADPTGVVEAINSGARSLLAMTSDEAIPAGTRLRNLVGPDEGEAWTRLLIEATGTGRARRELDWRSPTGRAYTLEVTVSRRSGPSGKPAGWTLFVLDLTDAAEARAAAARSELRWRTLIENLPETVVMVVDEDLRYQVVSGGGLARMGLEDAAGRTVFEVFGEELGRTLEPAHREALTGSTSRTEFSFAGSSAEVVIALVAAPLPPELATHGRAGREALVLGFDVTEQRRHEEVLTFLAEHDPLTGLANRRRFDAELRAHLERRGANHPRGALLMLDLDQFKAINDTLGHSAGDEVIIATAEILKSRLRAEDVVARLGGDEFAVLLRRVDAQEAAGVALDIVEAVRAHEYLVDGSPPRRTSVSVGVVPIVGPIDAAELMATADLTMYDAKESGRDRYAICDAATARPRMAARLAWAERIVTALAQKRFLFYAQPILDIGSGTVTGAEILLRMRDEDGAIVAPSRFLDVAERVGLIVELDALAVDRAIEALAEIQPLRPWFRIEVNISGLSVGEPALTAQIIESLARHGVDGNGLVLEITETVRIPDFNLAREFMTALRRYGVRFALDDFGSGFGSLSYLKHLRFDYLKIDGDFVNKCHQNSVDRLIIDACVSVARGMGTQTIAEFVVDSDVLDVVRDCGVDHAQGFHIGGPVPVGDLIGQLLGAAGQLLFANPDGRTLQQAVAPDSVDQGLRRSDSARQIEPDRATMAG